jgi:septum formation protein
MVDATDRIVLGSRSPRRRELLSLIVPPERIIVCPPSDAAEPGFEKLRTWPEIETQLAGIARMKNDDVSGQLEGVWSAVLTADTVIVGQNSDGALQALGQPPENDAWRETVREWFRRYYFGRSHTAVTALCVTFFGGFRQERLVKTDILFRADAEPFLDWYLSTDEPKGKAGGYALQGAGSLFVERIEGSPSNVVGLPLRETFEILSSVEG